MDCWDPHQALLLITMNTYEIKRALREFTGTEFYYKHLFPGRSPILLTDGCYFIRTHCNAYWLFMPF
jgi:hypothetical protein